MKGSYKLSYIGVDISYANGNVNLATAKRHGLQFCIMRIGFGANEKSQDDIQFLNNYNQCMWWIFLYLCYEYVRRRIGKGTY